MASMDEMAGSSGTGTYGLLESEKKTFARLAPELLEPSFFQSFLLPEAQAAVCDTTSWSACATNVMTRTFGGCTVGGAAFNGTVALTFNDGGAQNTCTMGGSGGHGTVERNPNFTITGRRGGTFTVSKTSVFGQKITRTGATSFTFESDGINRAISIGGTPLFNFTTETQSPITITGANRSGRVVSGGPLRVTNNLSGVTCDFTAAGVTWVNTCNCPTSGSWSGSCSDGKAVGLTLTGCGSAVFTLGDESESMTFDRCSTL